MIELENRDLEGTSLRIGRKAVGLKNGVPCDHPQTRQLSKESWHQVSKVGLNLAKKVGIKFGQGSFFDSNTPQVSYYA